MIDRKKPIPFYWQIKEIIEREIIEGRYKVGEVVATQESIVKKFNVSPITAIKALQILEKEGYVKRERKKGTILVSTIKTTGKTGLYCVRTKGHLFHELSGKIINSLSSNGFYLIVSDWETPEFEKNFFSLTSDISFIIIQGISTFPFHLLEKAEGIRFIFILNYEYHKKLPGSYILHQHIKGCELQISHLIKCGYENIIYCTYKVLPQNINQNQSIKHIENFLYKIGFKGKYKLVENTKEDTEKDKVNKVKEMLLKLGKNTGVICSEDYRAKYVYQAVNSLRWKIPEEVGIIGYFNTPWAEVFIPSLTSITIKEEKIAEKTVEIVKKEKDQEVWVKPDIVIRESTRKIKKEVEL